MKTQEELDKHVARLVEAHDAWEAFNNFYMRFPYIGGDKDCVLFLMLNCDRGLLLPRSPKNKLMLRIEELVDDPKNSQFKAMLEKIKRQPTQEEYFKFHPFYLQLRVEGLDPLPIYFSHTLYPFNFLRFF